MKTLLASLKQAYIITAISMMLIAILLLCFGDSIEIAGYSPFASLLVQSLIIVSMLIIYVLCFLRVKPKSASPEISEGAVTIPQLKRQLSEAASLMKQAKKKSALPCYIVLGPAQAGKSALINASGAKITMKNENDVNSMLNVTLTEQGLFIEIASRFTEDSNAAEWKLLLSVLKHYRRKLAYSALLLVYPLSILNSHHTSISAMHDKAVALNKSLGIVISPYLLITQMDRLHGFHAYFGDLSDAERQQAFGITLQEHPFVNEYDNLLKNLNARLLTRLHREYNRETIHLIAGFPLQMASMKKSLNHLVDTLQAPSTYHQKLNLQGLYFISSQSFGEQPINPIMGALTSSETQLAIVTAPVKETYFIHSLFKQLLSQEIQNTKAARQFIRQKQISVAGILGIILASTLIATAWFYSAARNEEEINTLTTNLATYASINSPEDRLVWLSQQIANTNQSSIFSNLGLSVSAKASASAETIYIQKLQAALIPALAAEAEQQMQDKHLSMGQRYQALKVYLMLGMPSHLQKDLLQHWAEAYWQQLFVSSPALRLTMANQLYILLNGQWQIINLNQSVLMKVRTDLVNAPTSQLAYLIISQSNAAWSIAPLHLSDQTVDHYSTVYRSAYTLNGFYTRAGEAYFHSAKDNFAKVYEQEAWVLNSIIAWPTTRSFETDLSGLYRSHATHEWQQMLGNVEAPEASDLSGMISTLNGMKSTASTWLKLMSLLASNMPVILATSPDINLHRLNFADFKAIGTELYAVQKLLANINNASNTPEAAFNAAKDIANNNATNPIVALSIAAAKLPEPMANYLKGIASNSTSVILTEARVYINQVWQNTVYSQYQQTLAGRYPLATNSNQEIAIADFSQFFATGGTLDNFVQTYLSPFIQTQSSQWQNKLMQNTNIGLSNNTLAVLSQASMLKTALFNGTTIGMQFSLEAVNLDGNIQEAQLVIGNQTITDRHDPQLANNITWSPSMQPSLISLNMVDLNGNRFSFNASGNWSWWHFMDQCQVQNLDGTTFGLNCQVQGHHVSYKLTAQSTNNVFQANLENLVLPSNL